MRSAKRSFALWPAEREAQCRARKGRDGLVFDCVLMDMFGKDFFVWC